MASICDDPGGRRRILFVAPDGTRKAIRLGKVDRKTAESIARHVEHLLAAKASGQPVPLATANWVATVGAQLHDKLVRVGLIDGRAAVPTVAGWCQEYIAGRTDLPPRSISRLGYAARSLVKHFGADRRLDSVTVGDAEAYARWLGGERGLNENSARRHVGWAKQFFGAAVKHELLVRNPFAGLAAAVRPDRSRDFFVTRDVAARILDACPDATWRLIVALCRFGGLRCPTEIMALRWGDVLWDQDKLNVPNPKTVKSTGAAFRTIPLFPEVRPHLEAVFDMAPEGTEFVITRPRGCGAGLRYHLGLIARKAGVELWDKPFNNMRASRATELTQSYPSYVATAWLGHSRAVAEAHYLQVTDEHFKQAAQNPAQQTAAPGRSGPQQYGAGGGGSVDLRGVASSCDPVQFCPVFLQGKGK